MTNDIANDHHRAPRRWRWIAAAASVTQLVTPPVVSAKYGNFLSTGATNDAAITPAGYAFSIWGLITALCTLACIAMVRQGIGAPWESRVSIESTVVSIGFTAWLLFAAQDLLWLTVAVLATMVALLVDVTALLVRHAGDMRAPRWLQRLITTTFGIYLGWTSIALCVNVAAALVDGGASPTDSGWQTAVLLVATAIAVSLTLFLRGDLGYTAAALWALAAVAVGAAHRDSAPLSTIAASAAAVVLSAAMAARRRHHAEPRRLHDGLCALQRLSRC